MNRMLIIGCGAHGRVVAETISLLGTYQVLGFGDDNPKHQGRRIKDWPVLPNWRDIATDAYFVAIGQNQPRKKIFDELYAQAKEIAMLVHPKAFVSPDATLSPGAIVLAGAVVSSGARIGHNVIVGIGAAIDHDAEIGDHAHIAAHAAVGPFAIVQALEMIQPGAVRLASK